MRLAAIALLVALCLCQRGHSQTAYRASVAATISCAALDTASSWGRVELNPVLASPTTRRFDGRSVAIKSAITGGILVYGWIAQRRKPEARRAVTLGNWIAAGASCGAAGLNWSNRH